MNVTEVLAVALLDLLYELRNDDLPLILGGGYGLYLKQKQVSMSNAPLMLDAIPPLRSTNDLDLFLRTELLVESARLIPLRDALDRLEFTVIASAQNYQFARKMEQGGQVWDIKVDLLAKPPDTLRFPQIKMDSRRIKPHPSVGIHAHRTNEAIAIEDEAASLTLSGFRSSGEAYTGAVFLPSTYALLLMKLFALRDQVDAENKGFGRKHALDLYTLVAILTEPEYEQTKTLRERYQHTEEAKEAARIVFTLFAEDSATGMRRLRENELLPNAAGLKEFRELLHEFFF